MIKVTQFSQATRNSEPLLFPAPNSLVWYVNMNFSDKSCWELPQVLAMVLHVLVSRSEHFPGKAGPGGQGGRTGP